MNEFAHIEVEPDAVPIEEQIKDRIIHTLKIYPIISPSMLHSGIGSSIPAQMWKPIYRKLVTEGHIKEDIVVYPSQKGRQHTYTLISLKNTVVEIGKSEKPVITTVKSEA